MIIFILAMFSKSFKETEPTLFLFGSPDPLGILAAFKINRDAGGVLVIKEKLRSSYTVISTGIKSPDFSWVSALNALQKSIIFTPCWPSAGPTGGAGLACPACICNLMKPETFFAI